MDCGCRLLGNGPGMAGGSARAVLGAADANESVSAAARSDDRMRCRRDTEGWPERGHPSLACEQPASGAGLTHRPDAPTRQHPRR
ncbi:MAG: hypothetical protein QOH09_4968 [Pseudonocardiales bacterium]|jgi:hypothetical protein|nr:hypothetical protein [Pseudonocardiales bacterium]